MTTTSMCAVHADAASVVTCRRCGRFCCLKCLPQFETCTECAAREARSVPPLDGRATLAAVALWASAAVHTLMVATGAAQLATGQTGEEGLLVIASGLLAIVYLPVFITTVVLVCMWFHRATRHALARGAQLDVDSPAGAVGSWFIPFVNLVRPFNLTRGMLVSAQLDTSLVATWQGMWLLGNVAANASTRVQGAGGIGVGLVSDVLMIGAAVIGAQIVRALKWAD